MLIKEIKKNVIYPINKIKGGNHVISQDVENYFIKFQINSW